jgi:hypothetical protein
MTLVIDDSYFKENYPLPFQVDTKRLAAVISMTQRIELRSILGDSFYQTMLYHLEDETQFPEMADAMEEIRLLHTLYVARALFTTYYKDGDSNTREYNISYLDGSIKTQETFVINSIVGNSELYGIASDATDNVFDDDADSFNTIYYPY